MSCSISYTAASMCLTSLTVLVGLTSESSLIDFTLRSPKQVIDTKVIYFSSRYQGCRFSEKKSSLKLIKFSIRLTMRKLIIFRPKVSKGRKKTCRLMSNLSSRCTPPNLHSENIYPC